MIEHTVTKQTKVAKKHYNISLNMQQREREMVNESKRTETNIEKKKIRENEREISHE